MHVHIRSRPIPIVTGSSVLKTEEEKVRLKALLTQYTMEWFSTASNIKNSHPFVTKFDETIEGGDRHVVHVTDSIPICCGCVTSSQSFVTSYVTPREDTTSLLWTSTIPHFQRYSTIFSIEHNNDEDTYAILDSVEYSLQWYVIPLQWYIRSQITTSHQHILDTACDCIGRQLNQHLTTHSSSSSS